MKAKTVDVPKPPKHLRKETQLWFAAVAADYMLEAHHTRLLTLAAEAWDRGVQAREALLKHGTTFEDRFGQPRARPEIAIERDSRTSFARLLRELALDVDVPEPGEARPPAIPNGRSLRKGGV